MTVRLFLKLTALTTAIIGLCLLFLPKTMVNIFLSNPLNNGAIFIQFLGSSLIAYSFLNLYASMYKRLVLVKANIIGNLATLTIAFFLSIFGMVTGSLNKYGVLIVVLHLTFGTSFGYYLYRLKKV